MSEDYRIIWEKLGLDLGAHALGFELDEFGVEALRATKGGF